MKIFNPANEELIAEVAEDSVDEVGAKYKKARKAQAEWAKVRVEDRIAVVQKFHDYLESNKTELASVLTSEVGKPLKQSVGELAGARSRIRFFIKESADLLAEEVVMSSNSMTEKIQYEPLGVIANISAWNYPYLVGVNVFIPALIAGNAVLYKPSEYSTLTGLEIARAFSDAGLPEGLFQVVVGKAGAGQALIELPLDGYFFTGSHATGQRIYEAVAPKMVPCQMELGGKDPLYVTDENADMAKVAAAAAEGAFYNNGQSCCAVERIYVHENVYDAFMESFLEEVKSFKVGSPTDEDTFIGPLTRGQQAIVIEGQIQDAVSKGAKLELGGKAISGPGHYFEPTVLSNVNEEMIIMKDESFGPVIGVQKVANDDHAIQLMQDTEYGLTASVYSDSYERAESIMDKMNVGTVYWNCCDRVSANVPWSGRKHSGFGSTLSHIGIRAFTRPKAWHLREG